MKVTETQSEIEEEEKKKQDKNKLKVTETQIEKPKLHERVKYLPVGEAEWKRVLILSKAGKKGGKYEHWLNVCHDDETTDCIDWENGVQEWSVDDKDDDLENLNEVVYFSIKEIESTQVTDAKFAEVENWKRNHVYEEVPFTGQKCVSVRWVFTEKFIDGKKIVKARLVARGFEETESFQVDSPTCSKESLRIALTIMVSKGWTCNSIDVKVAFLQGRQIDREVFIEPPLRQTDIM